MSAKLIVDGKQQLISKINLARVLVFIFRGLVTF